MQRRFCLGLGLLGALLCSLVAFGMQADSPSREVADLATKVQGLNEQLVTRSKEDLRSYTPDKLDKLTTRIRDLLTEFILSQLNQTPMVSKRALARQLRAVLGEYVVAQEETNTPYVSRQTLGASPIFVTAYLLYRGGAGAPNTKAVVQAFVRRGAEYSAVGEVGNEFDGHGLFLTQVTAQREGEIWYLAHGVRFGASHRNLTVVLYSFDGLKLRPVWQKHDLPRGELNISDRGVELKYLDMGRYRKGTAPYFRTEKFRFGQSGLVPESP